MKSALKNKAFTLFELIIVIVLIGLVYGVFVNKLSSKPYQKNEVTLKEIKLFLGELPFKKSAQIACEDACQKCTVYLDDKKIDHEVSLFRSKPVVYTFDEVGRPKIVKFAPLFDQEGKIKDICFAFKIFKNGGGDAYIVEYEDVFYVYKTLEQKPQILTSINQAMEYFDHSKILPVITSDYQYQ